MSLMHRAARLGWLLFLLAVLALHTGCATAPQVSTAPLEGFPDVSRDETLFRLEKRREMVKSFTLAGEIVLVNGREDYSGDHLISGLAPDMLRAEILGPFGRPILLVVVNGRELTAVSYRENLVYRGQPTPENLARFLGLGLTAREVFGFLIGAPPLPVGRIETTPGPRSGLLDLMLWPGREDEPQTSLLVRPADGTVLQATVRRNGQAVRALFSRFKQEEWTTFPLEVELTADAARDRRLSILSDTLQFNPDLAPEIFSLEPPPGLEVRWLP